MLDDVAAISASIPGPPVNADHIRLRAASRPASAAFDVGRLLEGAACYAVASLDDLAARPESRTVDSDHVLSVCTTHVDVDGEPIPAWADLSGVYRTADGRHLQVHCNFAHHAAGLVDLLGTGDDRAEVGAAIAERMAFELETELVDAGLIGAAIRTLDEWDAHPHALVSRGLPLVTVEQIGQAPPACPRPVDELRVLDCSRVLAGPVAGQLWANAGADVLRLGAAHLPSVAVGVLSTGFGKRNAFADLRTAAGRATMTGLLAAADVWIDAYRPGSMASHGFGAEQIADIAPGIVVVQISAFDWVGPWAGRRGFDSIVQSTTGVRWAGGRFAIDQDGAPVGDGPAGLPVQALDYATGFLAAGVAGQLVRHQREVGGTWIARLSLLRTRNHLVALGGPRTYVPSAVTADPRHLASVDADVGRVTAVTPFAGGWTGPPRALGTSPARWR